MLNIPQLTFAKIVQLGRHETVTEELGSQVQSLLEVTFLVNSFYSNTILAALPE